MVARNPKTRGKYAGNSWDHKKFGLGSNWGYLVTLCLKVTPLFNLVFTSMGFYDVGLGVAVAQQAVHLGQGLI